MFERTKWIAALIGLLSVPALAQDRVTWESLVPRQGSTVTIYYDANQGTLPNPAGQVYIHLGFNGWTNIISPDPAMTATATSGLWSYIYNIPATATVIDLVFNDGQDNWDNNGTKDWHIQVFQQGLTAVLQEPVIDYSLGDPRRSPVFASVEDTIHIHGTAVAGGTAIDSLSLAIAGVMVARDSADSLVVDLPAASYEPGFHDVIFTAIDKAGASDTIEFTLLIHDVQPNEPPPPGTVPGVTVIDGQTATIALFAPHKNIVYLIGDFDDWLVTPEHQMKRYEVSPDSVLWWLTLTGLSAQEEYGYQYLLSGGLRAADPFSTKLLDPWNDSSVPASTYPDLKPYPVDLTVGLVSAFHTGTVPFTWHDANYERPQKESLVIYEMLVRDFVEGHDYSSLLDKVDYLAELGVNAVELLPINEFEGNSSWGYNTIFHTALDKYYGPPDAFKTFVDSCHSRGIAVIIDMVFNHVYRLSSLVQLYWDQESGQPAAESPWLNQQHNFANSAAHWGFDLNHESEHTQYYVDRVNRFWIEEFHVDGFRFDFTKGFGNNPKLMSDEWGSKYDGDRIRLLKRMADSLWETDSTAYVILEHLAENAEEVELANHGLMLWGNSNYNYNEATMGWHEDGKSDFSWGYYGQRGWSQPHLVTYMESHDEERLMYKNLTWGNASSGYSVKRLATALNRMKLAGAFFFTLPGPKMIWQFQELGYDYSIDYGGRLSEKPVRWDYLDDPYRKNLYKAYTALTQLRHGNPIFSSGDTKVTMNLGQSNGIKRMWLTDTTMQVTIIGNFGIVAQSINPNFQATGYWYDYFSGDSIMVSDVSATITVDPGRFNIFTNVRITPQEPEIEIPDIPTEVSLRQNYPNPFNLVTAIGYSVPEAGRVILTVYDLTGREVARLFDGYREADSYNVNWTGRTGAGRNAASGLYICRLSTNAGNVSRKMMLLR